MNPRHYSLEITWDEDDKIYIVNVPELPGCKTHGKTYDEAISNATEVIELWIEAAQKDGWPIPQPKVYVA
ncbi:MAG TPA: type II toxin-antitoxin system HicB family antitoxin [Ktedonobacteraceae bacterium]|jgi:predicted RNase H-like HicB family nuclease|nr:type II toxin-antitoxin system HicB family antitoxin [Ktedonobacteraceae bacterium]